MKPQIKKIVLLSIVFSLVGIVVLGLSFYFLYVQGVQEREKELDEIEAKKKQYEEKKTKIEGLKVQLSQLKLRAQKALQQIPPFDEKEFDSVLGYLRQLAKTSGVTINPPRVAASPQRPGAQSQQIVRAVYEVSAFGDFKKLWDFLKVMESSIRFVEIETFAFTKSKGTGAKERDTTALSMRISVFAFRGAAPSDHGQSVAQVGGPESTKIPK